MHVFLVVKTSAFTDYDTGYEGTYNTLLGVYTSAEAAEEAADAARQHAIAEVPTCTQTGCCYYGKACCAEPCYRDKIYVAEKQVLGQ